MLWFLHAIGAAMCWGLTYVIAERIMNAQLTPAFLMLISCLLSLPFYLALSFVSGSLATGVDALAQSRSLFFVVLFIGFTGACGNFLIFSAVNGKNATLAAMVEISYPLFTILFAWLLFRDVQMNAYTALGGVLVTSGVAIILLKG